MDKHERALAVFQTICEAFRAHGWEHERYDDRLLIESGAQGLDLPMNLTVRVAEEGEFVILLSKLPFVTEEDKRIDMAIAVSAVNNLLYDGSFDYDVTNGQLVFRLTESYIDSSLSRRVFEHMLFGACKIVDRFNDKLMMLAAGRISLEQFIEFTGR